MNSGSSEQDAMAQSMKTMNYLLPVMSGFFCLSLNMGIGLYWIVGSLFRIVQCILINRSVDKISMEDLIEKNKEKAAKKSAKLEERNRQMQEYARTKTSSIKSVSSYQNQSQTKNESTDSNEGDTVVKKDIEKGSISGYAKMLSNRDGKK